MHFLKVGFSCLFLLVTCWHELLPLFRFHFIQNLGWPTMVSGIEHLQSSSFNSESHVVRGVFSPSQNLWLLNFLDHFCFFFSEFPYKNEPGYDRVSNNNAEVVKYNHVIQHETIRIAVCAFLVFFQWDQWKCVYFFFQDWFFSFLKIDLL